jgi:hypothetical protein
MADSGLTEFKQMLADFNHLGALAAKVAVALPLAGLTLKVGPPPANAVSILASLAEFLVLAWAFHFWYGLRRKARDRRMKAALISFSVGLILSLILIDMFTLSPGPNRERVVKGFVLQPFIKPLMGRELATVDDALRAAGYDASEVWLPWSVTTTQVGLIAVWLFTFSSLAAFLALFVMARTKPENAPASGKSAVG